MKILFLGEYSRLHNTLKEGLNALGHEVVIVSDGDFFKNYPTDIDISSRLKKYFLTRFFVKGFHRFSKIDLFQREREFRLKKIIPQLKNFDVVQLVNQDPFVIRPKEEIKILKSIFKQNKKSFALACGDDSLVIDYYEQKKMRYSILTPVHLGKIPKNKMNYSYKYLKNSYKKLYDFVNKNVSGFIPTDLDYAIPYAGNSKDLGLIPNPVNIDKIKCNKLIINDKINIFFGVNTMSFYKKGGDIVLKVLEQLKENYKDLIQIEIAENLPYDEYIKKYDQAHIFIDQLYSYDQGYNALEAMAKGKCVLTGAEKEFIDFYNLQEEVAVNALPDEKQLFDTLESLIQDKERIIRIGQNARKFIEKNHNYIAIANKYLKIWTRTERH